MITASGDLSFPFCNHPTHFLILAAQFETCLCGLVPPMHFSSFLWLASLKPTKGWAQATPNTFWSLPPIFVPALFSLRPHVPGLPSLSSGTSDRVGAPDGPCPTGFERVNGSCVGEEVQRRGEVGTVWPGSSPHPVISSTLADVDECATGGRCQHGECANTRGGYTCVCPDGFLLDSSRSSCICEPLEEG